MFVTLLESNLVRYYSRNLEKVYKKVIKHEHQVLWFYKFHFEIFCKTKNKTAIYYDGKKPIA